MKSKSEIAAVFYTILTALVATKGNAFPGVPNGHLYAQLINEFELDEWLRVVRVMKDAGLVTEENYLLQITPKGEEMHAQLDKIYQEARNEKLGTKPSA